MFGFKRKPKLDPGNAGFDENPGTYKRVFENKKQPTPGAMSYAWETLGLVVFEPVGRAQVVKQPRNTLFAQSVIGQAVRTNGIPTTAGQVFFQPLYDPERGFTRNIPGNIPAQASFGIVATTPNFASINDPSPDRIKGAP